MPASPGESLSRRERQIMDVLYRLEEATVSEVVDGLDDAPSYSAVRTTLGVLREKGQVRHRTDGRRFVYAPVVPRAKARRAALSRVVTTFFDGAADDAVAALLELKGAKLTAEELERIARMIDAARKRGR